MSWNKPMGAIRTSMMLPALWSMPAVASENGGSIYPIGADTIAPGILPGKPDTYYFHYSQLYTADRTNGSSGDPRPIPNYDLTIEGNAERILHVSKQKVAGGNLVLQAIVPHAYVDISAGPRSQDKYALGDVSVGAFVAWHSPKLHGWVGPVVYFPTGGYDKADLANVGRNHYALSLQGGVSYFITPKLDVGVKGYLGANSTNKATHYRSGKELVLEYLAAYRLSPSVRIGLNGFYYDQLSDDRVRGGRVGDGNQGKAFAIGPLLQFNTGKLTAVVKYQKEVHAENRAQGGRLWLQTLVPF